MNRKGDNSFNLNEERSKYEVGMEIFIKKKTGKIIYKNDYYVTVQFKDGIKESFVWHELFEKMHSIQVEEDDDDVLNDGVLEN